MTTKETVLELIDRWGSDTKPILILLIRHAECMKHARRHSCLRVVGDRAREMNRRARKWDNAAKRINARLGKIFKRINKRATASTL